MIIIKDTLKEIWRGKISYVIFILFLFGFSHTAGIVHSTNELTNKYVSFYSNGKLLFILLALLIFSFIWKSFIFIFISSFTLSKFSYQNKLNSLFTLLISKEKFLLFRILSVFILSIIIFIFWDILFFLWVLFFEKIGVKTSDFFFYMIFENFLIILGLPVSLFFGFYFSPLSVSFIMFLFYFLSSSEIFFTPFVKLNFPFYISIFLKSMPNFISLISYFPLKFINPSPQTVDITPNFYDFYFFLFVFVFLFLLSFIKINKIEYDIF